MDIRVPKECVRCDIERMRLRYQYHDNGKQCQILRPAEWRSADAPQSHYRTPATEMKSEKTKLMD